MRITRLANGMVALGEPYGTEAPAQRARAEADGTRVGGVPWAVWTPRPGEFHVVMGEALWPFPPQRVREEEFAWVSYALGVELYLRELGKWPASELEVMGLRSWLRENWDERAAREAARGGA